MANNPLDELVQTSSDPVAGQPGLADVGNPSTSSVPSSVAPDMPSQSAAVPSSTPPTTQNPLDELISGTTSTPVPTNVPSDETSSLPSPLPPLDVSKAEKSVSAASTATTSPSTMSAAAQAQPSIASLDNPLDSLITHESTDKQPEPDAGLQSTASQPAKEKPLSSSLDAFAQPVISPPPPAAAAVTENPLPQVDKPATLSGLPEHDIAAMPLPITPDNTPAAFAPAPSGTPSPEIKPATVATINADQASTLSKKELEEKAKKLLKDSPPKSKGNKKPWILGLLTLLLVVGAAGGGLFAYRLINPESTDQRSQASGGHAEYCRMTVSNFDQNPLKTCNSVVGGYLGGLGRVEIGAAVNLNNATEPNPINTNCTVIQWDGDESGDLFVQYSADNWNYCRYESGNDHCFINNVRSPFDAASQALLKAQFQQKCAPISPTVTATLPSPTQSVVPTANGNLVCTPNQTLGNLSYDIKLTNITPTTGFEQANFQLCLNPASNAGHKLIFQNFFNSNASYKDTNLVNGVPTWACYQVGSIVTQLTSTNQITHVFNRSNKLGNTAAWAKTIDEFAAFIDAESSANRIDKLLRFQIKSVLQANGVMNDQFVVGAVMIHPTACIGPSPSPSPTLTPNPSAPPLACVSLAKSPATIPLGSAVTFTCNSQPNAAKYEFRYKVANGAYINLTPDASNISTTNLIIKDPGSYTVECRVCEDQSGTKCTTWGRAK